jgi:hypothetical protein
MKRSRIGHEYIQLNSSETIQISVILCLSGECRLLETQLRTTRAQEPAYRHGQRLICSHKLGIAHRYSTLPVWPGTGTAGAWLCDTA